jgi:hypothetical protein
MLNREIVARHRNAIGGIDQAAVQLQHFILQMRDSLGKNHQENLEQAKELTESLHVYKRFLLPSSGFIGLLYRDPARPYHIFRRHTGVDIFGNGEPGDVPVVAVYDGYLTRLNDWFATVIIRHDDPLQLGRTIWTYYTHMGNRSGTTSFVSDEFPPGTADKFVKQGTLLGYQGKYAGIGVPVGLHVHLSIVASDADGSFKNEAILDNTLDPSPYFGLPLNIDDHPKRPIKCGLSEN